jgi:UDPglucose 6-dehydrogenase
MKIGIVGQGFVGNAVRIGFESHFDVLTYDKYQETKTNSTLEEIVLNCKVIFSCLPTPMTRETGAAHLGIVESVLAELNYIAQVNDRKPIVVVKSTVPPGSCQHWHDRFKNIIVSFNPEFLTEANAIKDFLTQDRVVLGRDEKDDISDLEHIFILAFPGAQQRILSLTDAEMVKYVANCLLTVKVSFANEIYDICEKTGADYNAVIDVATMDKRLGNSHWMVPGPDGHRGFSGSCFPKDINALRAFAKSVNVSTPTMDGAWEKNLEVRPERDWEQLKGRAIL